MSLLDELRPPGDGSWELETTYLARPLTLFTGSAIVAGAPRGLASASARYGLMLGHVELAQVRGFIYRRQFLFGAPDDATVPPPQVAFQLLTRFHPRVRARLRTGARNLARRAWRDDVRRWEEIVRPAAARLRRDRQTVDVGALDDEALARHLDTLWHDLAHTYEIQHGFALAAALPVGDLVAHAVDWTGLPHEEVLAAVRGPGPPPAAVARPELAEVVSALRHDAHAIATLRAVRAPALATLGRRGDPIGAAVRAYLLVAGIRCVADDLGEGTTLDHPGLLVHAILSALDGRPARDEERAAARVRALRERVPPVHREPFDELLAEARLVGGLRDERTHDTSAWLNGLARRAVLEGGARLVRRDLLPRAELLLDASLEEMVAFLRGEPRVSPEELERRRRWRESRSISDAPAWLGVPPSPPPPAEWLPAHARRAARAAGAILGISPRSP